MRKIIQTILLFLLFFIVFFFPLDLGRSATQMSTSKPAEWITWIVDPGPEVGVWSSIDIHESSPGIAYYDMYNSDLKYAHRSAANWILETVDSWMFVGGLPSLKLDSGGNAHIAYFDWSDDALAYAIQTGSGWQSELIDEAVSSNQFVSIDLDGNDFPHIVFKGEGSILNYVYRNEMNWFIESLADEGSNVSMKLDRYGYPHVCYSSQGNLVYGFRDESGWHFDTVDDSKDVETTSLALDEQDMPHISYCIVSSSQRITEMSYSLNYAYKENDTWYFEIIDDNGYECLDEKNHILAVDSSGAPVVGYVRKTIESNWTLLFAHQTASGWMTETVNSPASRISMALDSDDNPHFSYYDPVEKVLMYTRYFSPTINIHLPFISKGLSDEFPE